MRTLTASLAFSMCTLLATAASADDVAPSPDTTVHLRAPVAANDVQALAFAGGYSAPASIGGGGLVLSGAALARLGIWDLGLAGGAGSEVFGDGFTFGSVLGGVGLQTRYGLRADLLAELGVEHYSCVGCELLSPDPGASATLPFAGVRVGLSYRFFENASVHPEVGLWGFGSTDFMRPDVSYAYSVPMTGGWPAGGNYNETHSVGELRYGAMLALGVTFDVSGR